MVYTVYPWIFQDIPSFLKPDFSAGHCCLTHSMCTDQECFIPLTTIMMAIVSGGKAAHERLTSSSSPLAPCSSPPLLLPAGLQPLLHHQAPMRCRSRHCRRRRRRRVADAVATAVATRVGCCCCCCGGGSGFFPGCLVFKDFSPCQCWG